MTIAPTLPYDEDAERAALGSCLMDRDAIVAVAPLLRPEHFWWPKHADVYRAILTCYQQRTPPDVRTVTNAMRAAGTLDGIGGVIGLASLLDAVPTASHVEFYARIVARHAAARALVDVGGKIAALGFRDDLDADAMQAQALSTLSDATAATVDDGFTPIGDVLSRQFDRIQTGEVLGMETGYYDVDRLIGGLQPGNLVLLAGIPGSGKTAFAVNLAWQVARRDEPAAVVSLEMSEDELAQRITAQETGIPTSRQRGADLDGADLQRIIRLNQERAATPLYIEDKAPLTTADLRARALRLHAQHGPLRLLVVDYLGLLALDTRRTNTATAMNNAAQDIKNLAKELRCPVVLLSQLNREIFKRADRRPMMSDLREAGEAPADQVLVVMRDEQFDPDTDRKGEADFYLLKNRHGPPGRATLRFEAERTLFSNMAPVYRTPEGY